MIYNAHQPSSWGYFAVGAVVRWSGYEADRSAVGLAALDSGLILQRAG